MTNPNSEETKQVATGGAAANCIGGAIYWGGTAIAAGGLSVAFLGYALQALGSVIEDVGKLVTNVNDPETKTMATAALTTALGAVGAAFMASPWIPLAVAGLGIKFGAYNLGDTETIEADTDGAEPIEIETGAGPVNEAELEPVSIAEPVTEPVCEAVPKTNITEQIAGYGPGISTVGNILGKVGVFLTEKVASPITNFGYEFAENAKKVRGAAG